MALLFVIAAATIAFLGWRGTARPTRGYDWPHLRALWRQRLAEVARRGQVPVIDMDCGYYEGTFEPATLAREMDRYGIALITMTPELRDQDAPNSWKARIHGLMAADSVHFVPLGCGSLHDIVLRHGDVDGFLTDLFATTCREGYPLLGETFFRHYPSLVQYDTEGNGGYHDVDIPIDGPAARRLFALSQETDVPLEIHLEAEDALVRRLDRMLGDYPKARVIWCHFGRVRRLDRGLAYGPRMIRRMLADHPNLYFETSCTAIDECYLEYGHPCRLWDRRTRHLLPAWRDVIVDHPGRFMAAIDLGPDRMDDRHVKRYFYMTRSFLAELPRPTMDIVAYRAAWRFMFGEEIQVP